MQCVNLTMPGWVKPGVTVLSVAAIATIGFAGTANASSRHPLPVPSASVYRQIVHGIRSGQRLPSTGTEVTATSQDATPVFGLGKEVVYADPMPGTFPEGTTPDLGMVTFNFEQAQTVDSETQDVRIPCDDDETGRVAPFTPCGNLVAPLMVDQPFTISYDSAASTLPSGFLAPATVTDTISSSLPPIDLGSPSTAGLFVAHGLPSIPPTGCATIPISPPILTCNQTIHIQVPGTWRPVGLDLTNKVTGKRLANTKFTLSQGSTALGTATTDSTGHLKFPGVYQGGNFTVTQKTALTGYGSLGAPLAVKVPAVTTAAQAGKEYDIPVKLAPLPPNAVDDTASTSRDKALVISVLHNDTAASAPLTITSVAKPQHGTAVANPDGTITYTPNTGFSGSDSFTYAVRNALGGTDTATVKVTVIAPSVLGDRLAMTGQASWLEAEGGLGSVLVGGLLVFAGRRRRGSL